MTNPGFLSPKRRSFQWLISLLILLIPWGRIDGTSLLRVDVPSLSLQLFGATLRIEELYLLLIFSLALVMVFLLVTLVFGRVWCGWACPQTTLSDLAEWAARRLKLKLEGFRIVGAAWRKGLWHLFSLVLSLLVGSNLLWYFIEPRSYFKQLFTGQLHPVALITLVITAACVYLDMAFLRRRICSDFCPYGRFQTVLVDRGTLALQLPPNEMPRCIDCGACVRICPMEIDIRQGYQIECINCGRCLDACRQVMARRDEPGLIGYYFGAGGHEWKALFNPRSLILFCGFIGLSTLLTVAILSRAEATLKVALSHQVSSRRLADGSQASFFNAWLNNRTTSDMEVALKAQTEEGVPLELKGPTHDIPLAAGRNLKIDFVLVSPFSQTPKKVTFILITEGGEDLARAQALITAEQSR